MRQVHHLEQGSPEWHAHRATPNQINGSEIAAIMGLDKKTSRSEMLRMKALGGEKEFSDYVQKNVIDKGHEYEAMARPLAEAIIDDDLSPLVMTDTIDGVLISVSLDGITQGYDITFEHKSLNITLADALDAGVLPDEYHPQCEAGLMVSGATRCLFMASKDGDGSTARHYWYESRPELRPRMIAACKQYLEDVANYVHVETVAAPVAAPIKDLPAIVITATGSLSVETNFAKWEIELRDFIKRIPEQPSTDQEFADCKAAVAAFKKAEEALDAEEARVLTMVPSVDDMRRHKKLLRDLSSTTRLALEKLVAKRDVDVKNEIVTGARTKYEDHIKALNTRLGGQFMPHISPGFSEAMKSKRSYATMRDAVDTALAQAKIEANEVADLIEANRKMLTRGGAGGRDWIDLFPDFAHVCTKSAEDFHNLVTARVSQDVQRQEAEREKIRQEEADKLAAESKRAEEAKAQQTQQDSVAAIRIEGVAPEAPALSQEPTGAASMPGGSRATDTKGIVLSGLTAQPVSDETLIDDFLKCRAVSPADKKALRVHLLAWETYRVKREMAAAA